MTTAHNVRVRAKIDFMRKKKYLRKLYATGLIVGILFNVAGCATTPDSSIVTQKNNERLKETAKKGADENNSLGAIAKEADSRYDYKYENTDRTLTVTAAADVWLPDKDTIPMYEVAGGEFSQELVTKVYNYFFQGEETYRYEGSDLTKQKCEEKILELQQQLAEVSNDEEESEEYKEVLMEEIQTRIDDYKAIYDDLPEESTLKKVLVDSILTDKEWYTENGKEKFPGLDCESDTGWFSVSNFPSDSSGWSSMKYEKKGKWGYSGLNQGVEINDDTKEKAEQEIGISYEDAKKVVDDFMSEMGIPSKECVALGVYGYFNDAEGDENEDEGIEYTDRYTAYKFFYTRTIDDIPFAATSSGQIGEDETAPVWCYERIGVFVEKEGIVRLDWEFPVEVKENVSENVGIISFENVTEIFEQMMPIVYEGQMEEYKSPDVTVTMGIEVSRVELALMRVRDSGAERKGLLTPTWVFYGSVTKHCQPLIKGEEGFDYTEEAPWIVLAVNAVDGSVINIVEGY